MTRLQDLYDIAGQSPWLDNLRRDWLQDGKLADLVQKGVRGITSNPTILAKAISGQNTYDDQFKALMKDHTVESAYWELAISDIEDGLKLLRPTYDTSDGEDGFVSLEVSPALAHDTDGTVRDARMLHDRIKEPNLLVKVPATRECVPSINTLIGEGRSINVTLIFGIDRYDEVMEAYISGLETMVAAGRGAELAKVASVASFFVSRVDTEVDRRLETLAGGENGDAAILALRGKAAVAQARVAYRHFRRRFLRPAVGSTGAPRRPGPAPAVGVDVDQEPGLRRSVVRELADRAGHGEHHAGGNHRRLRGARHRGPHGGRRSGRRHRRPGPIGRGRDRHDRRGADAGGRGCWVLRQVVRRAAAVAQRQSRHVRLSASAPERLSRAPA